MAIGNGLEMALYMVRVGKGMVLGMALGMAWEWLEIWLGLERNGSRYG